MLPLKTVVLFLYFTSGQIVAIPGFHSGAECADTGKWYHRESMAHPEQVGEVKFACGPGPADDLYLSAPNAAPLPPQMFFDMLRGMMPPR